MDTTVGAALGALLVLVSCGSGESGGGAGGGSVGGSVGLGTGLAVTSHSPANGSVEIPTGARIRLQFDGNVVANSLNYTDTGLFRDGSSVAGHYTLEQAGRTVVFNPQTTLSDQTDYEFRLSPLTCDTAGRILDQVVSFGFRTVDAVAPSVSNSSVAMGQTGVSRTDPVDVDFSEALLDNTVSTQTIHYHDQFGTVVDAAVVLTGDRVSVTPVVDLGGDRDYRLQMAGGTSGLADLAGNSLNSDWFVDFRTAQDTSPPFVVSSWPDSIMVSPLAHVRLGFSESVDPGSVEPSSIVFIDQFANFVMFNVFASPDQRQLRLAPTTPLVPGRAYAVSVLAGTGAVTDMSSNEVAWSHTLSFTVGADTTAPAVATSYPVGNQTSVSLNVQPMVTFDQAIDPASISGDVIELFEGTNKLPITVALESGDFAVRITPTADLTPGRQHTLVLRGGFDGVRDSAGNPLVADHSVTFNSTTDATLPTVMLLPSDGSASVPYSSRLTAVFDQPMDPSSISDSTVFVTGPGSVLVPGTLTMSRSDRVIRFDPTFPFYALQWYTLTVVGGPQGVHELSGNHLAVDQTTSFRTSSMPDSIPPFVTCTINGIDSARNLGLTLPPYGFDINIEASDPNTFAQDMSTVSVTISGPGTTPGADAVFAQASLDESTLHYVLPKPWSLAAGTYQLTAQVTDLSGNTGTSNALTFRVAELDGGALPFERTQVMWVRFTMDRDNNGRSDLDDDLLRLGLMAAGDPAGTNGRMRSSMRAGILAACNDLFGRDAVGTPVAANSFAIRLTDVQPIGITYSSIACAGMDPEGAVGRTYGSQSTGVLGRAYFDYRNGNIGDHNTGTSPGLGVFPAEVFFFEVGIQLQVGQGFLTSFSAKFKWLCPEMGGTPAGAHALDPTVLNTTFDYSSATSAEQARYDAVFGALDDWSTVIATVLAHEIGHSVGLVAQGGNPLGLHGDASLHNQNAGMTNIMAAALGYDSMLLLPHSYRDVNAAYLSQRLMMK